MLRHFIHAARRKPKAVRNNIALGVAGGVTTLVVGGWVLLQNQTPFTSVAGEISAQSGAFSGLIGQLRDQAAAALEAVPSQEELELMVEIEEPKPTSAPTTTEAFATDSATTSTPTTTRSVRIATTTINASQ